MATKRKYGYYLKGNNIAIIEEGLGSGLCSLSGYNTQTACENAGGTWTSNGVSVDDGQYSMLIVLHLIYNLQVKKVLTFIRF